jgi:hypothetical protein
MAASMKISITRALAELKLLDSRINRAIEEIKFAVCVTKKTNYNVNKNDFTAQTTSEYQSINDLINRREKMKAAIMKSNSVTAVKIGTKEMTVSEAIEMKHTISYKKYILEKLREQRLSTTKEFENHKNKVKQAIDANITQICSRDVKPDPATIQDLTDMFYKNDPCEIFDPLGLDKLITQLTAEVEDFELNVDFALSEANSLTQIEV